jgi:hypothetical protein
MFLRAVEVVCFLWFAGLVVFQLHSGFTLHLWTFKEQNLSQTSCKVPYKIESLYLVSLLKSVISECLVNHIWMYFF